MSKKTIPIQNPYPAAAPYICSCCDFFMACENPKDQYLIYHCGNKSCKQEGLKFGFWRDPGKAEPLEVKSVA